MTNSSILDPFYRMRTHEWVHPVGTYFDTKRIRSAALVDMQSRFSETPCAIALLCASGESPLGWSNDLARRGLHITHMVGDPDNYEAEPPYDGIRHVVGLTKLGKAIDFVSLLGKDDANALAAATIGRSSSITSVRFLRDQPDAALASALQGLPEQPNEEEIIDARKAWVEQISATNAVVSLDDFRRASEMMKKATKTVLENLRKEPPSPERSRKILFAVQMLDELSKR